MDSLAEYWPYLLNAGLALLFGITAALLLIERRKTKPDCHFGVLYYPNRTTIQYASGETRPAADVASELATAIIKGGICLPKDLFVYETHPMPRLITASPLISP